GAGRDHDHVSGLYVVRNAVLDVRSVVARSVVLDDGPLRGGTPLSVGDVGAENERGRSVKDAIDLADLIMLRDRVGARLVQLLSILNADADPGLADVDRSHLLIDQI